MCGRYSLAIRKKELLRRWPAEDRADVALPRYNIAPGQRVPVIRRDAAGTHECAALQWGLVPAWSPPGGEAPRPINARSETLRDRPFFRELLDRRRCLVPADSFFEWRAGRDQPGRGPLRFLLAGRRPFALAGLWDCRLDPAGHTALETFVILTVAANECVRPVHDRMPVILQPFDEEAWLDPRRPFDEGPATLLRPYPAEDMEAYAVSALVNSPEADEPACIAPAPPALTQGELW